MASHTRRSFLKTGGAAVGIIASGTTITAARSRERYIVDAKTVRDTDNLEVVHRLDSVDLLVVRGSERDVNKASKQYVTDIRYSIDRPVENAPRGTVDARAESPSLSSLQWDKQDQNIPEVHEVTRGEGTRVAIIDSGVAAGHPDLQHAVNIELSRNFTDDSYGVGKPYGGYHGTHVAGIVAANDRNGTGVIGSAPGAEIVDCRVFSEAAPQETLSSFLGDVLAAIVYSAEIGCDAANLSLGAYLPRQGLGSFYGKAFNRTTTFANRQGTLLVHAAGNVSTDLQHDNGYVDTSESAQSVNVSATGPVGFNWGEPGLEEPFHSPAFYTNYGTNAISFGAPGGDIDEDVAALPPEDRPEGWYYDMVLNCIAEFPRKDPQDPESEPDFTAEPTYTYDWLAGTSMAAPQVAGAAALVKSVYPDYNANQVESALTRSAEVPSSYEKTYYGSGYIDPLGAVRQG